MAITKTRSSMPLAQLAHLLRGRNAVRAQVVFLPAADARIGRRALRL
jgi:hypothetical protein